MTANRATEELLNEVRDKPKKSPTDISRSEKEAQVKNIELQNQHFAQKINLQKGWSRFIRFFLVASAAAVWVMIFLLGCCWIQFEAYPWLPHTIISSFFVQVIGLGYIVAKYLFPHS